MFHFNSFLSHHYHVPGHMKFSSIRVSIKKCLAYLARQRKSETSFVIKNFNFELNNACFSLREQSEHKKRASKATFLLIKLKYFRNNKVAYEHFSHKNLISGHLLQVVMPKDFRKMFDSFQFHPILHCEGTTWSQLQSKGNL